MNEVLDKRISRAVSRLAGNESLFAELGTGTARIALDWGIAATRQVVGETGGLDEAAAEAAGAPRLRAIRQVIRLLNQAAAQWPAPDPASLVEQILDQGAIVYGAGYRPPTREQRQTLTSPGAVPFPQWAGELLALLAPPAQE